MMIDNDDDTAAADDGGGVMMMIMVGVCGGGGDDDDGGGGCGPGSMLLQKRVLRSECTQFPLSSSSDPCYCKNGYSVQSETKQKN